MDLAQRAFDGYNAGGDPATANKTWDGKPVPAFGEVGSNVRAKWAASADGVAGCVLDVVARELKLLGLEHVAARVTRGVKMEMGIK